MDGNQTLARLLVNSDILNILIGKLNLTEQFLARSMSKMSQHSGKKKNPETVIFDDENHKNSEISYGNCEEIVDDGAIQVESLHKEQMLSAEIGSDEDEEEKDD